MRLSQRIYDICSQVNKGESVADIGTDHGYVPMILVRDGISPYAIMSDISEGSLSKAVETFREVGIETEAEQFRLADGLKGIDNGEVDDIIIAGLGGYTIIQILDEDIEKTRSYKRLIMQPRKFSGNLRYYLYTHGFDITGEVLSPEGKFICETICAQPTDVIYREAPYPEDDIRWKYPEEFAELDYPLLKKRLDWKFSSIDEEINNLKKSSKDNSETISVLKKNRLYLEELLESCRVNSETCH